jgi:hypothetical protein
MRPDGHVRLACPAVVVHVTMNLKLIMIVGGMKKNEQHLHVFSINFKSNDNNYKIIIRSVIIFTPYSYDSYY